MSIADLLAGDAASVRDAHARLVDRGTPPAAAATYLAYTEELPVPDPDAPHVDETYRSVLRRSPVRAGEPRYCTTCSFRSFDDAVARQCSRAELSPRRPDRSGSA